MQHSHGLKLIPSADNTKFFKQQCQLYIPHRKEEDLLQGKEWQEIYQQNLDIIKTNLGCIDHITGEPDPEDEEIESNHDPVNLEEWMAYSRMGPQQSVLEFDLGLRDIDIANNWHASAQKYDQLGGIPYLRNFLDTAKKNHEAQQQITEDVDVELSTEQKSVLDLSKLQIDALKNQASGVINTPKRIIIQGKAGTGKSLLISKIVSLATSAFGPGYVLLLAPTGVSSVNINGATIHSTLKINPKQQELTPLKGPAAIKLQQRLETIKFVIIDEFSMVGCKFLNKIDKRLRQATGVQQDFGGLHVSLLGDVKQLAPIGDSAPYHAHHSTMEKLRGKQLYDNFQASFVLSKIYRQQDEAFLKVLDNISFGQITQDDYNILKTRFITSVSAQDRQRFQNSLHLFSSRPEVNAYNKNTLETLRDPSTNKLKPIAKVPAAHNSPDAAKGSSNDANGLEKELYLAEDAVIMLRTNLWTEKGLVNGAMGKVVDIIYDENSAPSYDLPAVLICQFPNYSGPVIDEKLRTVPIIPISRTWTTDNGVNCTRTQLLVSLAYATTIHKSQGLTLQMAFVDLGASENNPGLTYVGLSRVKSLQGLLLQPFSFKSLSAINKSNTIKLRRVWEENLSPYTQMQ